MTEETRKNKELKVIGEEQPIQLTVEEHSPLVSSPKKSLSKLALPEPNVSEIITAEEEHSNIEESWGNRNKTIPVGWYILAVTALFLILGSGVHSIFKAAPEQMIENIEKNKILDNPENDRKDDKEILMHMQECVRQYLSATEPNELLPYVRDMERVKPLIHHHYKTHAFTPLEFEHFSLMRPISLASKPFVYVKAKLNPTGDKNLLLEQVSNKEFKVDWESDVAYMPIQWEDYIKKQPTSPIDLRVRISKDNFYSYEFSDEEKYQSYRLTTLNSLEHLFAFTEKDSPLDKSIKKHLGAGTEQGEPMILRLRFPKNSHSKRCVIIESLIEQGWTYTTPPPPLPKE